MLSVVVAEQAVEDGWIAIDEDAYATNSFATLDAILPPAKKATGMEVLVA
jgi:hypothetical protein